MPNFQFQHIRIAGIASAVPTKVVKSTDFISSFGEEAVRKFVEMTGVQEHREVSEHQTASDLAFVAAEKLLREKQIDPADIRLLVFGSHSGDYRRPGTFSVLHKRLGLSKDCAAFDVGLGCSAFVYCIQTAASMLSCSDARMALVLVGETLSRLTYKEDRSTAMLFGDGGSAILLQKTEEENAIQGKLCTDGTGYRAIIVPAGGFRNLEDTHDPMTWADGCTRTLYNTNMNGTDVFSFTITKVPKTIKEFLDETKQDINEFDCLAFHQANRSRAESAIGAIKSPEPATIASL